MKALWLWPLASLAAHGAGALLQRAVWTAAYWPPDRTADGDAVRSTLLALGGVGLTAGASALAGLYAFVRRARWPSLVVGASLCLASLLLATIELYATAVLAGWM